MKLKCGLCPNKPWIDASMLVEHMETVHEAAMTRVARWPDGQLAIFNEDALEDMLKDES